ncbi:TPA: FAD-binding oxidoreductase [Burkholderia multivorans]|nr:FAD-binding oxidoreductase [Burkholderia multivorans]
MDFDVIVLGAGIVGVSVALHLQDRGRKVALVDRSAPGEGTSFGNAGLIERSSVEPYPFPRSPFTLMRYALNRSTDLYWHSASLPAFAPWLARFWWESAPQRHAAAARDMLPLIERCIVEHDALIARAGAGELVRASGWMEAFRTPAAFERGAAEAQLTARRHGLGVTPLDAAALLAQEPSLAPGFCGALHWRDPKSVVDPSALVKAYARLFEQGGGTLLSGDAASLSARSPGWEVATEHGTVAAPSARGVPSAPIVDREYGYVIAPMRRGLRLTTGVEIARRRVPPTGVQLERAERIARPVFGFGERLDPQPWLGFRPCTPDMRPVIGPAPAHRGMWFAFGHNHHGLTLGPVTGRLLAEMMTGDTPFTDPAPYRADRF